MKFYIQILLVLFYGMTSNKVFSQAHPIYEIEKKMKEGDKNALLEIAYYFDSQKELIEYLGYHKIETHEGSVAKRIVLENSLFTNAEISINKNTSGKQFSNFVTSNFDNIFFSKIADAFLITPLDKRNAKVEFREISDSRKNKLTKDKEELQAKRWVKQTNISELIEEKDPQCLLIIASELYKIRYRFNTYNFDQESYIDFLQLLTNTDIGVENEKNEISWHIDKAFYPKVSLNLLIYFSRHYGEFKWNSDKGFFENMGIQVKPIDREISLFQLLNNENDSIALNAFIHLTTSNTEKVLKLSDEYDQADIDHSYVLPTFPYKFLKQIVQLTSYCKKEQIDFIGSKELKNNIVLLEKLSNYPERRDLEDKLINSLTLNDITAFEYWALIHEGSWRTTYAVGRILDIFYSNHFKEILADSKQLKLYLKKSYLFDRLGIIGVCGNYLTKFTNLQELGIISLSALISNDTDINNQISEAKSICRIPLRLPNDTMKVNDANRDSEIKDLKQKIFSISKIPEAETMEDSLTELLSQISYNQIGEAMDGIENILFEKAEWKKYSFLERDFGFFIYDNFDRITTRDEFRRDYERYSEFDFYKNMLSRARINYFNIDNTLEYDKIFDALKYNVVIAFVGGGGGKQDNEVYAIIKLLELTHKTTLGYPDKLCNSDGMYACDSMDRASYWMQYLQNHKLLKTQHNEPVSFHYE